MLRSFRPRQRRPSPAPRWLRWTIRRRRHSHRLLAVTAREIARTSLRDGHGHARDVVLLHVLGSPSHFLGRASSAIIIQMVDYFLWGVNCRQVHPARRHRFCRSAGSSKTFPGQVALDGVDLVIDAGSVHALVGQNGSGKSTLIKILAGYHQPDPGAVAFV